MINSLWLWPVDGDVFVCVCLCIASFSAQVISGWIAVDCVSVHSVHRSECSTEKQFGLACNVLLSANCWHVNMLHENLCSLILANKCWNYENAMLEKKAVATSHWKYTITDITATTHADIRTHTHSNATTVQPHIICWLFAVSDINSVSSFSIN